MIRVSEQTLRRRLVPVVLTALLVVATAAPLAAQEVVPGYGDAQDPAVLAEMIERSRDAFALVDVRTAGEFRSGHIPTAENIDYRVIAREMAEADRSVPVVVYCRSGNRSARAAATLTDLGFTVVDFGGIIRWPGPVERGN